MQEDNSPELDDNIDEPKNAPIAPSNEGIEQNNANKADNHQGVSASNAFSLDDIDASTVTDPTESKEESAKQVEEVPPPYSIDFDPELGLNETFTQLAVSKAQDAGLAAKDAKSYTESLVQALKAEEGKARAEAEKNLIAAWGDNYDSNMKDTKRFIGDLKTMINMSPEELAFFASPQGFDFMHRLSSKMSESSYVSANAHEARSNPAEEAQLMLTDPSHPDYEAIMDSNHPRHTASMRKYNKMVGLT